MNFGIFHELNLLFQYTVGILVCKESECMNIEQELKMFILFKDIGYALLHH